MEQRVGIARILANDPLLLLMDEPFGSLDAQTRMMMQEQLLTIWEERHKTVIFVTHDIDEAILLADRLLVLTAGPARVKKEIKIPLERPRSVKMMISRQFVELKEETMDLIREETMKAMKIDKITRGK
jgi:ABC-type nitrate/sulfonate/bicarbonate transport system ATPase subunit